MRLLIALIAFVVLAQPGLAKPSDGATNLMLADSQETCDAYGRIGYYGFAVPEGTTHLYQACGSNTTASTTCTPLGGSSDSALLRCTFTLELQNGSILLEDERFTFTSGADEDRYITWIGKIHEVRDLDAPQRPPQPPIGLLISSELGAVRVAVDFELKDRPLPDRFTASYRDLTTGEYLRFYFHPDVHR